MSTLKAPRGVTRIAGANAYAAKFAISPVITATVLDLAVALKSNIVRILVMIPAHHSGLLRYEKPSPSKPCLSLA